MLWPSLCNPGNVWLTQVVRNPLFHHPKHSIRQFHSILLLPPKLLFPSKLINNLSTPTITTIFSNVFARENSNSGVTMLPKVVNLPVIEATPTSFQEYGQVIEASIDGEEFGPRDAQLDLSRGIPRFYIMHLKDRPFKFSMITHHANVTQCLGSIGGHVWYLGIAKASIVNPDEVNSESSQKFVQSNCGHFYVPPAPENVQVFRISGPKFVKLHAGTWHAGPLFKSETMDFYNLELSNTNVVDHTCHNFSKEDGVVFAFDD